jgi:hypothetical protein
MVLGTARRDDAGRLSATPPTGRHSAWPPDGPLPATLGAVGGSRGGHGAQISQTRAGRSAEWRRAAR